MQKHVIIESLFASSILKAYQNSCSASRCMKLEKFGERVGVMECWNVLMEIKSCSPCICSPCSLLFVVSISRNVKGVVRILALIGYINNMNYYTFEYKVHKCITRAANLVLTKKENCKKNILNNIRHWVNLTTIQGKRNVILS